MQDKPFRGAAVYPGGVILFRRGAPGKGRGPGGPRGKVREFSRASRRRLALAILRYVPPRLVGERRVFWLTLTAPGVSAVEAKRRLLAAFKRVCRRGLGKWGAIWRLEYQRNGAAHLHLLVVAKSFRQGLVVCKALLVAWLDLSGGDARPFGQCAKVVRSLPSLALYVSDMGKLGQSVPPPGEEPGRWWGVVFREIFPLLFPVVVWGSDVYFQVARFFRGLRSARRRRQRRRRWRGRGCLWEFVKVGSPARFLRGVGLPFAWAG